MRVHHINCATMCPVAAKLVTGDGGVFDRGRLVAHCLVIEGPDGLVLVDTGFGTDDIANAETRIGKAFLAVAAPALSREETAVAQIERLGYSAKDVRHIVVTHLDLDHAGGLADFKHATVHLHAREHAAAMLRATAQERHRYQPAQWAHEPTWKTYAETTGDAWFGLDAVRGVAGTKDEVLLVPLFGHTRGHSGVAVKADEGWLLHAGDAYFFHGEMDPVRPHCTPGLSVFQRLVAMDNALRVKNRDRLQTLARDHAGNVRVFSAHCAREFSQATR